MTQPTSDGRERHAASSVQSIWTSLFVATVLGGCRSPDLRALESFTSEPNVVYASAKGAGFSARAVELAPDAVSRAFGTSRVASGFRVFWISVTADGSGGVVFHRGRVMLADREVARFPVGPGRLAFLCRSNVSPLALALAVAVPVAGPALGGTGLALHLTGVGASAATGAEESANRGDVPVYRVSALPETAAIPANGSLSGLVYFECERSAAAAEATLALAIETSEGAWESVSVADVPSADPLPSH